MIMINSKIVSLKTPFALLVASCSVVYACVIAGNVSDCQTLNAASSQSSPNGCAGIKYAGKITSAGIKKNVSTGSPGKTGPTNDSLCSGTWTSDGVDCTGNKFEVNINGGWNVVPNATNCSS
jgi:hypothetical protein